MHFLAIIAGLAAGVVIWFAASQLIASSILWAEANFPRLAGSKRVRAGEMIACGALFIACLAIAISVALLLMK